MSQMRRMERSLPAQMHPMRRAAPSKRGRPRRVEESLYKKKPSLEVTTFDEKEELSGIPSKSRSLTDAGFEPEELNRADLNRRLEDLKKRRENGKKRIRQMKEQADRVRRSIQEAQIVRPIPGIRRAFRRIQRGQRRHSPPSAAKATAYTHPGRSGCPA